MNSIRKRLLSWQIGAIIIAALLVSLITYQLAWDGFSRVRDFSLEQIAYSILRHGIDTNVEVVDPAHVGQFISQIWDAQGTLVFSFRPDLQLPRQEPGLHNLEWLGDEWHIFTVESDGIIVQVANTTTNRSSMFAEINKWLWLPLVVLITVLASILWMAVGVALKPLDLIRRKISSQDIERLHGLPVRAYPIEIVPLVDALNNLFERLDHVLTVQRDFVADAAHELRTPLTAIKLQTQIALGSPAESDRQAALLFLQAAVDRATHLIEQLLQLARLDPASMTTHPRTAVRLDALARQMIVEFSDLAELRQIDLGLGACESVSVPANAESLRVLLGNLIENALSYCLPSGRVDIEVRNEAHLACLWVIDTGPGIPDNAKEVVFERFHRLASADIPGSGLGLAIVKEIVTQHNGGIELHDTSGGGLSVRVTLPQHDATPSQAPYI